MVCHWRSGHPAHQGRYPAFRYQRAKTFIKEQRVNTRFMADQPESASASARLTRKLSPPERDGYRVPHLPARYQQPRLPAPAGFAL